MNPVLRSSGNFAADRRYDYARGAAAEGDHAAAADLCEQALELAPEWAPAWFALGEARAALGEAPAAEAAFTRALACDPADSQGAGLRLARLHGESPARPPDAYVRDLFDQYAARFEEHLVRDLAYRAPEILRDAIERACQGATRAMRFDVALDLGCGTGLMAREMGRACAKIDGVDLAPAMAARARATGLYGDVEAGDMHAFVAARPAESVDLVLAADVFVYCGDLASIFAEARRVLSSGGLFAFTLQRAETGDYTLGEDMRYAHSRAYLARLAADAGFETLVCDDVSVRQDRGVDVPGLALVLVAP
ncbi:MAG: SAM-dependent methyltransferase [Hyphomicrobiales bacterium]|nr:SAM-dependent methyltransferase [Hyphomicrobiales bacterium]